MDTKAKAETFEQKILEVLREEIGVEIGEEFDIYEKDEKLATGKFEKSGLFCKSKAGIYNQMSWEYIACDFYATTFKRRPFTPKYGEDYFYLAGDHDEKENIKFRVLNNMWVDDIGDYSMLALGNVFRSEKEALASKDKLLEKLEKLRRGEV